MGRKCLPNFHATASKERRHLAQILKLIMKQAPFDGSVCCLFVKLQNSSFTHCETVIRVLGETNTRRLQLWIPWSSHHFQPSLSGSSDLSKRNANVKRLRRNSSSEETSESIKSSISSQVEDTRCRNSRLSCGTHCLAWRWERCNWPVYSLAERYVRYVRVEKSTTHFFWPNMCNTRSCTLDKTLGQIRF